MKIVYPRYYEDFKCIDKDCEDTCCAGWEVLVDKKSKNYYKTIQGDFGNRLKEKMIETKDGCFFKLTADKRCPFLNENMYCDIYTNLGKDALCETCTDFPRFKNDYGGVLEIGISPACYTAAKLILDETDFKLLEKIDNEIPIKPNDIDPERYIKIRNLRQKIFNILSKKEDSIEDRMIDILKISYEVENNKPLEVKETKTELIEKNATDSFLGVEIVNEALWQELLSERDVFINENQRLNEIKSWYEKFLKSQKDYNNMCEQILFYYFYRYVLESTFNKDILSSIKLGIIAFLSIRLLSTARFYKNNKISKEEIADIFHLYSRYLEHSENNMEYYLKSYKTKNEYSIHNLISYLEKMKV